MGPKKKLLKKTHTEITDSDKLDNKFTINELNDDCLTNIFMFLPIIDRIRIERVSKRWKDVSNESWQRVKKLDKSANTWGFEIRNESVEVKIAIYKKVLQLCGYYLRHLDFSQIYIKSNILHSVANLCPNLQSINIQSLKLTLPTLQALTKHCHRLIEIVIGDSTKGCTDLQLSKLFLKNKQLQSLRITKNNYFSGELLLNLPAESMKSIALHDCIRIIPCYVTNALAKLGQLETFILTGSPEMIYYQRIHIFPTSLKVLEIPQYQNIDVYSIIGLTNLEKLIINQVISLTDSSLIALAANCKKLNHINISECHKITDTGLQAITKLPKIEYLNVSYLNKITDQSLKYMTRLKILFCEQCENLKDDGLCTLVEMCESIELIDVSYCPRITNVFVDKAINATKNRTNNVILNLKLVGTAVDPFAIIDSSSLINMTLPCSDSSNLECNAFPCFLGNIFSFFLNYRSFWCLDDEDYYYHPEPYSSDEDESDQEFSEDEEFGSGSENTGNVSDACETDEKESDQDSNDL